MNATDPMAAIGNYINAFNHGDGKGMAAMFTVPGSILDGMAPHLWQGPTAAQDWYRDVLIEGKQHGASDMSSRLASRCTTTSPEIAPMSSRPRP